MIQDEFLLSADEAALDDASAVEPAAFGASPMLVQDAPPIIDGSIDSLVPGSLPSASGVLEPVDPSVTLFHSKGLLRLFLGQRRSIQLT